MTPGPITQDDLADAGRALYGDRWLTPLADALGVNIKWIQRAMATPPKAEIRDDHVADLKALLLARRAEIDALLARLP